MSRGGFRDLFTMGEDRHLHRTILAYVNQVFQQISGINLITYYAETIYQQEIGLNDLTSRILAAANGTGMESFSLEYLEMMIEVQCNRVLCGLVDRCLHYRKVRPASAVSIRPGLL